VTVSFLMARGILVQCSNEEYELLSAGSMTGSEGYSAERMRRLRDRKLLASHCDAPVTLSDEEKREKRKEKEKESREDTKRNRFVKPTAEELTAYANEIDYNLRVQVFLDYYDGNGWMVGKNHMKDWKATVRQWKRRDEERGIDVHARRSEPTREDILASITPEQQRIIDEINARGENYG